MRMLEELTKRIESGEKKIEDNEKKVETYNSCVDQISGAPPVLKGLDAKKFIQKSFPLSAALMPIPEKFRMYDIPKYNGTSDPNEHITSYTCRIKENDLNDGEIESVLLKLFGETLSDGAMIWYHNLPPNSIDLFAILTDAFMKAHVGAIKVTMRKSEVFKIKQMNDEMLREFVSRLEAKPSRDTNMESRSNKEQYQPYVDRRNNGLGRNAAQNDQRNDRGQSSRGLMSRNGLDKHTDPAEAPRLSEYNFSVDASEIVLAIGRIKDTRWPKPIQSNPSQRNPNLMCKYHDTHGHRTEEFRQLREKVTDGRYQDTFLHEGLRF
uniref:Retrotransposon gag domain-containing protein n=1 Tax=Nicotiana tabacum TaxID=4097 RepID=A0A1S3XKR9_TOBAC|nr:PREDICTED: uncharacterized protein LOC107766247 [Nicotiana tabacum]